MSPTLTLTILWLMSDTVAQFDEPTPTLPNPEKLDGSDLNLKLDSATEAALSNLTETTTETTTELTTALPTSAPSNGVSLKQFLYCSCDLVAGQCDLNCCCDSDCSIDDRALFKTCWAPPTKRNDNMYCSKDDYAIAWNNTPAYRSENGGLFCIVTDNVPRYKVYEEKPPLKGESLFHLMPVVMNRWTENAHQYEIEKWVYEPFYKEGSPLFTLHAKGALGILKLPESLNSAYCNIAGPVEYLRQQVYKCHLKKQSCKPLMNPQEWLSDLAVFKLPPRTLHGAGNFTAAHGVQSNDAEKLVPVVLRVCDSDGCRADVRTRNQSCQVELIGVTLRVGFNGTQGIVSVLADLHYANASHDRAVRFETIFQPLSTQQGESGTFKARSGNPGYIKGKPLVVARFNRTTGEGKYQPLTLFPSNYRNRQIVFGQDSLQTIQIMKPWRGNLTDWCPSWQNYVLEAFWGTELADFRIGPFGNSNLEINKIDQWLPIETQTELSCFSTVIRSDLMVVYTRTGIYEQPQNKIIGVALGLRSDREAKCNTIDGCTLLLTQSVSFVYSETGASTVLPQPPRWRVHLPHDFFYPFLLSSSGVKTASSETVHMLVCFLLVYTLHGVLFFSR